MPNIDFQNLFTHEKKESIETIINTLSHIKERLGLMPEDNPSDLTKIITQNLNEIFTEKTCAGVILTNNIDNVLFGIYVNPTISNVDLMDILVGEDAFTVSRYMVEIDSKIFAELDPSELACYLLYNIEVSTGQEVINFVRFYIDKSMMHHEENIDIKSSINYSNILIFGIKDAINRFADLLTGVAPLTVSSLVAIREKMRNIVTGFDDSVPAPTMSILDWCLLVYTDLKSECKDAINRLNDAKKLTGSQLRRDEMDRLIASLGRASQESLNESVREQLMNEAKGFSLFKGLKQNGLRTIEDDLYEYKVRIKNCTDQDEAVYILRCLNTRLAVLDDYLATTDVSPAEQERWRSLMNDYREQRAILSSKKFGSASKNFNAFLNIDYDALDKLDQPRSEY